MAFIREENNSMMASKSKMAYVEKLTQLSSQSVISQSPFFLNLLEVYSITGSVAAL